MSGTQPLARSNLLQLSLGQVALQAGYFGFIASMPLALSRSGVPDSAIGTVVAIVALVQVPAALIGGVLVDRFGSLRMLLAGAGAYFGGAVILLLPDINPLVSLLPFAVARTFQGAGFGITRPAWLALLPAIFPSRGSGTSLGIGLSVQNISLIVMPPLSLAVLGTSASLDGVALMVAALVALGTLSLLVGPVRFLGGPPASKHAVGRRLAIAYHGSWTPPLAIMLLYLIHWGALTAYLPQHAELSGASVGIFFVADGLLSLILRVPSGWLTDRLPVRWILSGGLAVTAAALSILSLPITAVTLALAGTLSGIGAALVASPIYVELSNRSATTERGTAFAMVSVVAASAVAAGSLGLVPLIDEGGFMVVIGVSLAGLALAALVTFLDRTGTRLRLRTAVDDAGEELASGGPMLNP
jgi:MFS family permease